MELKEKGPTRTESGPNKIFLGSDKQTKFLANLGD